MREMDRVFSVDELSDGFWSPHAPPVFLHHDADVDQPSSAAAAAGMNRSPSEWAFQRFLQEAGSPDHIATAFPTDDVVKVKPNHHHRNDTQPVAAAAAAAPPLNIPINPEEYQALLKSRLELACAAVALTRAINGKATESDAGEAVDIGSQVSNSSSSKANVRDISKTQIDDFSEITGVPLPPAISTKYVAQVKSTTSGSSGDQSDDDEAEGETETTQNMNPADAKRMRRMLSNRESARRSRRRKQAHMTERETQVSQLRVENASLLKRFTDINQKYNESAVDNRVLKADVETLRAKVKMAEESVKRVTGLNSLFHAMSEISTMGTPSFARSSSETSADAAVPIPDQHYYQCASSNHLTNLRIQNDLVEIPPAENVPPNAAAAKVGRSVPMQQRLATVEQMQKHNREGTSSSGSRGGAAQP